MSVPRRSALLVDPVAVRPGAVGATGGDPEAAGRSPRAAASDVGRLEGGEKLFALGVLRTSPTGGVMHRIGWSEMRMLKTCG